MARTSNGVSWPTHKAKARERRRRRKGRTRTHEVTEKSTKGATKW